ncbi:hypothetical protein BIV23_10525 [Streptomyces monashensis]|uniref:Uncharacterized protein n=1 Tax=Streptomyces monashensis TaxID=1678012 RepID=A0A1S2QHX1_9ACTN|nr:hypothetical protein BIV23_10525 [Streptomyces monashensis]
MFRARSGTGEQQRGRRGVHTVASRKVGSVGSAVTAGLRVCSARAMVSESPRVTKSTPGRIPAAVAQRVAPVGMPYA